VECVRDLFLREQFLLFVKVLIHLKNTTCGIQLAYEYTLFRLTNILLNFHRYMFRSKTNIVRPLLQNFKKQGKMLSLRSHKYYRVCFYSIIVLDSISCR